MKPNAALIGLTLLVAGCTGLFFHPMRPLVRTPAALGLAWDNVPLSAADGIALSAWFLPSANGQTHGTVLFLHGNAENISTHLNAVAWLPARGFQVLLLDYRGYGESGGNATLAGMQLDIDAAITALLRRADVDPTRIVLLGQSLGGALGLYYAAHGPQRDRLRAVIADSTFSGYRDITREKLASAWLTWPLQWPLSYSVDDRYSPLLAIHDIGVPVLLIHGQADTIVPPQHAERLFAAASAPRELWLV
ncbi:MAG: alpha/beta fold hydrolase, partial [Betaproteobacteria bacterium]